MASTKEISQAIALALKGFDGETEQEAVVFLLKVRERARGDKSLMDALKERLLSEHDKSLNAPQLQAEVDALQRENARLRAQLQQAHMLASRAESDALTLNHISELTGKPDPVAGVTEQMVLKKRAQLQAFAHKLVLAEAIQSQLPPTERKRSELQTNIEGAHLLAEYANHDAEADRYLGALVDAYPGGSNGFIADLEDARLGRMDDVELARFHHYMVSRVQQVARIAPELVHEADRFQSHYANEAKHQFDAATAPRKAGHSYNPGYHQSGNEPAPFVSELADALGRTR